MVAGLAYLVIIKLIMSRLERLIPIFRGFPGELIEPKDTAWFISSLFVEFIFFVMMPAIVYGWFYTVTPFSGVRGGLAMALFVFAFGMVPMGMLMMFRIKLPALYVLFKLVTLFIKVAGSMAIVGYLYSL